MLKPDKRLTAIINEVEGEVLADIGCDHGKVAVYATLTNKVKKAIATDVSSSSIQKAVQLAQKYGVEDKITFVVGDGLSPILERPDTIIIAGMGANEIVKIIRHKYIDTRYIFVPHQDAHVLRTYLMQNDFCIHKDYVIGQGKKFYDIIVATKGSDNFYGLNEIYIGKNKPFSSDYIKKLTHRKKYIQNILNKVEDKNKLSVELIQEWEEINSVLQDYRCD